jgi:hypothetical protein
VCVPLPTYHITLKCTPAAQDAQEYICKFRVRLHWLQCNFVIFIGHRWPPPCVCLFIPFRLCSVLCIYRVPRVLHIQGSTCLHYYCARSDCFGDEIVYFTRFDHLKLTLTRKKCISLLPWIWHPTPHLVVVILAVIFMCTPPVPSSSPAVFFLVTDLVIDAHTLCTCGGVCVYVCLYARMYSLVLCECVCACMRVCVCAYCHAHHSLALDSFDHAQQAYRKQEHFLKRKI